MFLNLSKIIIKYLIIFVFVDLIYSNFFSKADFKHSCIVYVETFTKLSPNCKITEKYIRNVKPYKVITDKNGLRYSGKKRDPKKKNVVFFGDSFTYGLGLDYKKTYVGLLEKKIKKYNFLNYAVIGYSPSVYHYQLYNIINSNIEVEKVILALDITDFAEEATQWEYKEGDILPRSMNHTETKTIPKKSFKDKNLKASRFIASKINNFFRTLKFNFRNKNKKDLKIPGKSIIGNFLYTDLKKTDQQLWLPMGFENSIKKIERKIKKISLLAKSKNAEFYILIYPWPDTLVYGQSKFNLETFSKNLCSMSGCNGLINIIKEFEKFKNNDTDWLSKLFINGDLHFNIAGHKLISDKIQIEVFK